MTNLFTSQTPSLGNVSEGAVVTVGITFYVTSSGQSCKGGRFWVPSTVGAGTFDLVLYSVDTDDNPAASGTGTLLANVSLGSLGAFAGGWSNNVDFASPVALTANTAAYRIAVRSSEGRYAATGAFFNSSGLTNGVITAPQTGTNPVGIGNLDNGSFIESISTYPNKTFNGNAYFVDPNIISAGGTVDIAAASALTFTGAAAAAATHPAAAASALTWTGAAAAAGTHPMDGVRALTWTGTAAASVTAGGGIDGARTLGFGSTAAASVVHNAAVALSLGFGATSTAALPAAPVAAGGGWGSLTGVLNGQRADYQEYLAGLDNPTECPVHLTQLDQNAEGVLHCTFGGHIVRRGQPRWS
ncbi:MAG: DUF4082 domain-containing protein [Jiangellaceae bacterium]